ncbi:MAG: pseudouridine synthase [Pseudomonadales bacterium]
MRVDTPIDEKPAVSEFSLMRVEDERSEVDVRIETGRKHQVRRHLAERGFPIVGDRLYGNGASDGIDLQLTAYLLGFHCPVADKAVEYRLP